MPTATLPHPDGNGSHGQHQRPLRAVCFYHRPYTTDQPTISLIPGGTEVVGTAEPGSNIIITNGAGDEIGRGTADANGDFTIPLDEAQNEGDTLNVVASDAAGNQSQPATAVVGDVTPPDAPTDLQISLNGATVTGKAEAGSTVTIRDGDDVIGRGVADADGNFNILLSTPRLNGEALAVTATDAAGNTERRAPLPPRTLPRPRRRLSTAWLMTWMMLLAWFSRVRSPTTPVRLSPAPGNQGAPFTS